MWERGNRIVSRDCLASSYSHAVLNVPPKNKKKRVSHIHSNDPFFSWIFFSLSLFCRGSGRPPVIEFAGEELRSSLSAWWTEPTTDGWMPWDDRRVGRVSLLWSLSTILAPSLCTQFPFFSVRKDPTFSFSTGSRHRATPQDRLSVSHSQWWCAALLTLSFVHFLPLVLCSVLYEIIVKEDRLCIEYDEIIIIIKERWI